MSLNVQRARKEEDKELRRRAILDAARGLFSERGLVGFAMGDVAERTGLTRPALYRYWPTRESLLLAVLEELLWQWLDELDGRLDDARPPASPARLAAIVCESLASYAPLGRLLAVLQTVLERNVPTATIVRFKTELMSRMAASGARLERHVPGAAGQGGTTMLLHLNALLVGLVQMADSAPLVQEVLAKPPLTALRVDLDRELRAALTIYFHGVARRQ
jgi:AcrR family transcriptional regulator